jgi:hypothetical protein
MNLASPSNPFETARLALIKRLLEMKAPKAFVSFPQPGDFQVIADHVRDASAIFDEWIASIGFQVADNAPNDVDMRVFEDTFTAAIEGNATHEIEQVAELMIENRRAA